MVKKDDVDFYCGFSRKELQSLCKKYNLPANRSRSDMAVSLASYFEKSSLNPVVFGNQDSLALSSRTPMSRTWDMKRDSSGNELARTRENGLQGAMVREPSSTLGGNRPYQERNGNGGYIDYSSAPPYLREPNEKGPTSDSKKVVLSRIDSQLEVDNGDSPSSSSFEFHVSLEEGISLSVDLNFNPSDWINTMRDEVNVYDSMRRRKPPQSDLGISNTSECKKQKSSLQDKDEDTRRESSISPEMKDNTQLPSEQSLASLAIEPCSRIKESSDTCKEENRLNLSIPSQIVSSCVEPFSCCVNPVDLDCVKKLTSDSVMVAEEQNHPPSDLLTETPENLSMEIFQKVGNSSTVLCPLGAGSELSTYHANPPCSPHKTSRFSTLSSPELIIDRESITYSELFKFQYNGGNNCVQPNTEDQEKSEVLSEQARS